MIFDRIENAGNYLGLMPGLDEALKRLPVFIDSYQPKGRIEADGNRLYANCTQYKTAFETSNLFEVHSLYFDIHVLVDGEETAQYAALEDAVLVKEYDEAVEAALYSAETGSAVHLRPGFFAVFFPGEIHRTGVAANEETTVSKFIVKVLRNT